MNLVEQDIKNRKLALEMTQSFIVQAPAGSGKTELLIQRFLTLLSTVNKPEEILAITFTKKAANEMRNRLIHALQSAHSSPKPDSDHQKLTWELGVKVLAQDKKFHWNLLKNPNQLRIQTIDSLCAYLTNQLPLLAHFGSSPKITDDANKLYREAVLKIIQHLVEKKPGSNAIASLLLHLDNDLNALADLLIQLLKKRDQWLPFIHFNQANDTIKAQLEYYLSQIIQQEINQLQALFPKELMRELLDILEFTQYGNEWKQIHTFLLTKQFTFRKQVDKNIGFPALSSLKNKAEKEIHLEYRARFAALIEKLSELEPIRLALIELFYLPSPQYDDKQWAILQDLLQVLKIVTEELRVCFQSYGKIDYIENTKAALLALGEDENPTDLTLALDYQIKHILVDEFQDTSFTQYQLLEKLTMGWERDDGRTLFVVGDPMQSIYRFREAEVGLFIQMKQFGIGSIQLTPLNLAQNFRSAPNIVEWNNLHFEHIFPNEDHISTGAVSYTKSVSTKELSADSQVLIKGFLNATDEIQAQEIIKIIHQVKEKYPDEKIAILVRSRPHLLSILPALKKANLSYQAIEIDSLASRQYIQDAVSLTCALLHPADRISWLAILRSPLCGLNLQDLHQIANQSKSKPLFSLINNPEIVLTLTDEGQIRLKRILPILKNAIQNRERSSLRTWIENTWLQLGGPATLEDSYEMNDMNVYFGLLETLSHPYPALSIEMIVEKLNFLYASAEENNAIQIMTIHSAKGLEFDTVILPHLEKTNATDEKSLLLWMEQPLENQSALLLAPLQPKGTDPDPIYQYIERQQRIKYSHELDRLLYVATTRASKRLYLLYTIESTTPTIPRNSFLHKLWPLIEKNKNNLIEIQPAPQTDSLYSKKYLSRLKIDWENPYSMMADSTTGFHQKGGFYLQDQTPALIGKVVHQLMQILVQKNIDWWKTQSLHQKRQCVLFYLKYHRLSPELLDSVTNQILETMHNVINDPKAQWILHPHSSSQAELALTTVIDNQIQHLVLDRTFVDQNIRWIIDYKTASPAKEKAQFIESEKKKYSQKMSLYANALQKLDPRPIRLGLYFPSILGWIEWTLINP